MSQAAAAVAGDLEQVLGRVARRDASAFQSLYSATSAKLFGIILRILKDRDLSSECLQETYVKVWTNAAQFDPRSGRPITWLAAIARNNAIDTLRKRQAANAVTRDEGENALEQVADEMMSRIDPVQSVTLRDCLEELEDTQRQCVVLAYVEGYSRTELGERYSKPEATIKTWLRRGLMRLKECMDRT